MVDDLQGKPFKYVLEGEEDDEEEEEEGEEEEEIKNNSSAESIFHVCLIHREITFTAEINYASLKKEKLLGEGAFARVYKG